MNWEREQREQAEELQMEACLTELAGAVPAAGLADRITEKLMARRGQTSRRHWGWLAAAVVLAGLGVVAGVAWMGKGDPKAAVAQAEQEQDPERQPDAARSKRIDKLIRELELPAQREQAVAELIGIGAPALAPLQAAIDAEIARERTDVLGALRTARHAVEIGAAKRLAGVAADQPLIVIADYSDNMVALVGADGKILRQLDGVYGVWDAELLANGHLLLTEFSISRVTEVDLKGKVQWSFEGLKNPYDADRLPNGNTLIADTFGSRVIEVDPAGKIVWEYGKNIRPFDVDRLANGNTLIADVLQDRILEVSPKGEIAWQVPNMPNAHDADRLPNGNTLVTLRTTNRVVEVDRDGKVVFEIRDLHSPSDADRLPDGTTLVAENGMVRIFDRAGQQVWIKRMTWAVEANRY